jgi:hypothetical protein
MKANSKDLMLGNLVLDSGEVAMANAIKEHRVSTDKGKYPYSMLDEIKAHIKASCTSRHVVICNTLKCINPILKNKSKTLLIESLPSFSDSE